ncbi:MAG: lycopene cyclase family protein [Planctomycetota bacterium]
MHAAPITIAGAGPAGLMLARACAARGVPVRLIAPQPEREWPNVYGMWLHEAEAVGVTALLDATWPTTSVVDSRGRAITLAPGYGRLDGARAQREWLRELRDGGGEIVDATVSAGAVTHDDEGTRITLDDGRELRARLLIDATGHNSTLVTRAAPGHATAFQTAWGITAQTDPPLAGLPPDTMRLMDFSRAGTFLYAMPLHDGRVFLEETVLTADPPVPPEELEPQLHARLAALGVRVVRVDHVERCRIPMNTPLPRRGQRVVAFGGAGAMVHPASGYLLAHCLRVAPRVADAIARGGSLSPLALARAAERAVCTRDERRVHRLLAFGGAVVGRMPDGQVGDFFAAFFALPEHLWRGYLSRTASSRGVLLAMCRMYRRLPGRLRRRLVGEGIMHAPTLLRAMLAPG